MTYDKMTKAELIERLGDRACEAAELRKRIDALEGTESKLTSEKRKSELLAEQCKLLRQQLSRTRYAMSRIMTDMVVGGPFTPESVRKDLGLREEIEQLESGAGMEQWTYTLRNSGKWEKA